MWSKRNEGKTATRLVSPVTCFSNLELIRFAVFVGSESQNKESNVTGQRLVSWHVWINTQLPHTSHKMSFDCNMCLFHRYGFLVPPPHFQQLWTKVMDLWLFHHMPQQFQKLLQIHKNTQQKTKKWEKKTKIFYNEKSHGKWQKLSTKQEDLFIYFSLRYELCMMRNPIMPPFIRPHVFIYHERACVRCGGCDSRLQFPFVCARIAPVASYSPPSESAVRGRKGGEKSFTLAANEALKLIFTSQIRHWIEVCQCSLVLSTHLNDIVPAEDSACVASVAVFSDSAL